MPDIHFADISEWQENFDADAYLRGGYKVIIVRSHNGNRPDKMMPGRRDYVRSKPFTAVGYYIYLVAGRDAAQQAREFIGTVGQLRGNEFVALDLEEGAGNQIGRAESFFRVVDPWAGFLTTLYTGSAMLDYQLGGPAHWGKRPLWIARYLNSYQASPAGEPHGADWWQYSDRARFPGLAGGVDGNIHHGTAQQLLANARGGTPARTPTPAPLPTPKQTLVSVVKQDGRIETFEELPSGTIVHKWQVKKDDGWAESWQSLGKP